jgi:hypothetical protein
MSLSPKPSIEIVDRGGLRELHAWPLPAGHAISVAWLGDAVLVQTRQPSAVLLIDSETGSVRAELPLGDEHDRGLSIFHSPTEGRIACASCHPEAGDDGHTWTFNRRRVRTPSLREDYSGPRPSTGTASTATSITSWATSSPCA